MAADEPRHGQTGQAGQLRIGVVGTSRFVAGFSLAGIRDAIIVETADRESAKQAVAQALTSHDWGIAIIQEDILAGWAVAEKERLLSVLQPVVIFISEGQDAGRVTLAASIKRALGIDVSAGVPGTDVQG